MRPGHLNLAAARLPPAPAERPHETARENPAQGLKSAAPVADAIGATFRQTRCL